jgi:hypothetical protein
MKKLLTSLCVASFVLFAPLASATNEIQIEKEAAGIDLDVIRKSMQTISNTDLRVFLSTLSDTQILLLVNPEPPKK